MGLLAIPRALVPQPPDDAVEADQLVSDGLGQLRDVQAGEVVRLDGAVEVGPRHRGHLLVGQPQPLQHDDRFRARGVDGQLDVGQHPGCVGVGHEERAPLACRGRGELVPVDQPEAGFDGVEAETSVRQVEEREPGHDLDRHP